VQRPRLMFKLNEFPTHRFIIGSVISFCCLSIGTSVAFLAQSDRGRIVGTVRDSTRAVLPKVSITATNLGTGFRTRGMSSESGFYVLPYLPAGTFRLTAELSGFKTQVRGNVVLQVAQTLRQDITLEIGEL